MFAASNLQNRFMGKVKNQHPRRFRLIYTAGFLICLNLLFPFVMTELEHTSLQAAFLVLTGAQQGVSRIAAAGFDNLFAQQRFAEMVRRYTSYMRAEVMTTAAAVPDVVASEFQLTIRQSGYVDRLVPVTGNTLMFWVYYAFSEQTQIPMLGFKLVCNNRLLEYDQTVEYYNLDGTDDVTAVLVL
jgi:hypothetical protein